MTLLMQKWLLGLAQAGLGTGLTAVLLALVQRPLRRRIPARWFCAVWLLLALRLVIFPPLPGLFRLPLPAPLPANTAASPADTAAPDAGQAGTDAGTGHSPAAPEDNGAVSDDRPEAGGLTDGADGIVRRKGGAAVWLFAGWAVGCAGVLVWQLGGCLRSRKRLLRWAKPADERQRRALEREMAALGLRRPLRLAVSEEGPLLLPGLSRPMLVLPPAPEKEGPENGDLALVLRHELAHLARHDLAFKALLTLACALHWPNPLVWWMARRASAELELACDELVTRNVTPAERRCYGEAIIAAAARRGLAGPPLGTGFWGGKTGLRRRFEQLVRGPVRPGRTGPLLCGVLAAAVLAGSWLLGAFGPAAAEGGVPGADGGAPGAAPASVPSQTGTVWQRTAVDFALNAGAYAAPVYDEAGDAILAMQCEKPAGPVSWQADVPAVKLELALPEGWTVWPAAAGEEVYSAGNGLAAPFNIADANGEWVGSMQYGWFTAEQVRDEGGFYGTGSHAAYYWLWAQPGGSGWDEGSCRAAAGDAFLEDPKAAGALLCETAGRAQAGHEGILAHDGTLGRFVAIELRAGAMTEPERLRLAESIRLLAGSRAADAVSDLPEEPVLPAGCAWQEAVLGLPGSGPEEPVTVRLALPEGCTVRPDEEEETIFGLAGAGALILKEGETVGRISCGGFEPLDDWPPENPRMVYAQLMLANHAGWDFDYREIARNGRVSIALCLAGQEAAPRGPGPEPPAPGQEPENFADGWWYQKGILCCDNTLGVFAAVELEYGEFSETVRRSIAESVRLAAG